MNRRQEVRPGAHFAREQNEFTTAYVCSQGEENFQDKLLVDCCVYMYTITYTWARPNALKTSGAGSQE